jgi:hypothetical protein
MRIYEATREAVARGGGCAARRQAAAEPLVAMAHRWRMQPVCTRAARLSSAMDESLIALANAARDLNPQACEIVPCVATSVPAPDMPSLRAITARLCHVQACLTVTDTGVWR